MLRHRLRRILVAAFVAGIAFARVAGSEAAVVGRPEGELRDHLWLSWIFAQEAWDRHALPLRTLLGGAPEGLNLYPLDPLHQLAITLLEPAFGVVSAVNLVAFALFAVLVYGGQKLAASSGGGVVAEVGCGGLAAICPAFVGSFADTQTEGMASGWLLLLLAELFAERPRPGRVALWGCVLLATGPYLAHGVALVAIVTWIARRLPWRPALPVLATAGILFLTAWSTESLPGGALAARAHQVKAATRPPRSSPLGVAPAPPLPDDGVVRHLSDYPAATETGPRRHAPWALVGLVALSLHERRSRLPAALALLYTAIAAGNRFGGSGEAVPFLTPYEAFWRWMPLANYAWKPAQYAVPATAFALLAIARAWPRPSLSHGAGWLVATGALGAAAEATLTGPAPLPLPASSLHPLLAWSQLPREGGTVAEFPCRDRGVPGRPPMADVLLGPLWHGRPLAETPNRGVGKDHIALLASLEAAATAMPSRQALPLSVALDKAVNAGFTDLLILGERLGPPNTIRLLTALREAGIEVPEADADGVVAVRLGAARP